MNTAWLAATVWGTMAVNSVIDLVFNIPSTWDNVVILAILTIGALIIALRSSTGE